MKTKNLTAACTVIAMAMSFAAPAFANDDGGGGCLSECEPVKGNNGWGNGEDPTNAGSFSGATAETKSVNGPATAKFTGR